MTDANEKHLKTGLPKHVRLKDFNKYIKPHLSKRHKGAKPKISSDKIFNYILYVLHTGPQWHGIRKNLSLLPASSGGLEKMYTKNVIRWNELSGGAGLTDDSLLSYDKLKETRLGFRNLAYAMINFRATFNET